MNCTSTTMMRAFTLALLTSTTLCASFSNANAQALEEIVVTAQRREQNLQEVPIAITAFSAADLERTGTPDLTFLNQTVPNVTVKRTRATNATITAFIRGVGQQDPVAGFEQGVGIYLDDVYLNRPQGSMLDVYDIERIEVLRGPQGTLYGRNTIGGAVKYVTRRLGDETEFKLRGAVGTYEQMDVIGTATIPLTENTRLGGSVARFHRDGFGKNLTTGEDNYDKDVWATRVSLEITPSDDSFIRLAGDYNKDNSNPRGGHRLIPARVSTGFPVLNDVYDTQGGLTAPPDNKATNRGVSLHSEWSVNDQWTVKNILAYRDSHATQLIDFDALPAVDIDVPTKLSDDQVSEEFQVQYSDDNVTALAGIYALNANAYNEFDVLLARTGALIGVPNLNAYTYGKVDTSTWSAFTDATFNLGNLIGAQGLELSLGARYTSDKRHAVVIRRTYAGGKSAAFGGNPTLLSTTSNFNGDAAFVDTTPRAVLAYKPNADNNFFVSYSQGFKGGGFDPRGQTSAAPDLNNDGARSPAEIYDFMRFEPEKISTYEAGWKTTAMNGRLRSSLGVFHSDYTDVQIPGSIGVDTNGDGIADNFSGVTTNAGKAKFDGVEFEGSAILSEGTGGDTFTVNWALGYIDARYKEFFAAVVNSTTGRTEIRNVAAQRNVQNTPKWTGNLGFNYTTPMSAFGREGALSFIPSLSYRSSSSQFEYPSPLIDQKGYALVDASITWTGDDGLQLGLHGKNLTDKKYRIAGYDFVTASTLGIEGTLTAFYGDPLTVTATVGLKF
ncbi:MAG: TonB-dependent receptor [Rhodospirillaceae bacterium]|nr:TonB-dependent receptor [Rhodospirillaceae bacterium]